MTKSIEGVLWTLAMISHMITMSAVVNVSSEVAVVMTNYVEYWPCDQCTSLDHSDQNVLLLTTMINISLLITAINIPFTGIFPDTVEEDGSQQQYHCSNKDIDKPRVS